jgi:hypothetical protein
MNCDLQFSKNLNIQSNSEGLVMTLEHFGNGKLINICTSVYIVAEAAAYLIEPPTRAGMYVLDFFH